MPKGGYRRIRISRLEVAQFLIFLSRHEIPRRTDGSLFMPIDGERWKENEARRISALEAGTEQILRKFQRGYKKLEARGLSGLPAQLAHLRLGKLGAELILDLPIDCLTTFASMIATSKGGLFGSKRPNWRDPLWEIYPGAWIFAFRCNQALRARPGRPSLTRQQIEARLNESEALSESHFYRLLAKDAQNRRLDELPPSAGLLALLGAA